MTNYIFILRSNSSYRRIIMKRIPIKADLSCIKVKKFHGYIYITTNLENGKKYLGSHRGLFTHKYKGSGSALKTDMKKYGRENFVVEPIDFALSEQELAQKELFWLSKLNAVQSEQWYNILPTSSGWHIKQLHVDKPEMTEGMIKYSKSKLGREKASKRIQEYYATHPNFNKGENNGRSHPIVQLTLDGKFVREYAFRNQAEQYGFIPQNISHCCTGKYKQHKGYVFMYKSEYEKVINNGSTC